MKKVVENYRTFAEQRGFLETDSIWSARSLLSSYSHWQPLEGGAAAGGSPARAESPGRRLSVGAHAHALHTPATRLQHSNRLPEDSSDGESYGTTQGRHP